MAPHDPSLRRIEAEPADGGDTPRPLVSVVVDDPDGRADRVDATLASLAHRDDVEAVVVSPAPPAGFSRRRVGIAVFPLDTSYARNRGLAVARADIVAFVGAGVELERSWADDVLAALSTGVAAVCGDRCVAYDRRRLLEASGFRLFVGAGPASPAPDLEALLAVGADRAARSLAAVLLVQMRTAAAEGEAVGAVLRSNRRGLLAGRFAGRALVRAAAGRDSRRAELAFAVGVVRGLAGIRKPPPPAQRVLERIPSGMRAILGDTELTRVETAHKAKVHFAYRAGERVLHVYLDPRPELADAAVLRESLRRRAPEARIPHVHALVEEADAVWLLEDAVPGRPLAEGEALSRLDALAEWAVRLAGPPGGPLESGESWAAHDAALRTTRFAPATADALAIALDAVARVPGRHLHGDLQPKNVLVDGDAVAAVDWENAALHFLPGVDLVFLALVDAGPTRGRGLVDALARGEDQAASTLRRRLDELGIDDELLPHALVVMLGTWALGERRRRARLGVPAPEPVFEPLLDTCAATLVR